MALFKHALPRFITCLALLIAPLASVQAVPILSLSASNPNGMLVVRVNATDFVDLYGYQFNLNFDPTLVQALPSSNPASAVEGPFLSSAGSTFFDAGTVNNALGVRSFVFDTLIGPGPGASGSGVLATFGFSVLRGGLASFSLSDVIALNSSLADIPGVQTTRLAAQIPEPASAALLLIALLLLPTVHKRRGAGARREAQRASR